MTIEQFVRIVHFVGLTMGVPGDANSQRGALRDSLRALETMKMPESMIDLPFSLPEGMENMNLPPSENPPIAKYVVRHPWHLVNFFRRDVPAGVTV